jgi:hypothetical protein
LDDPLAILRCNNGIVEVEYGGFRQFGSLGSWWVRRKTLRDTRRATTDKYFGSLKRRGKMPCWKNHFSLPLAALKANLKDARSRLRIAFVIGTSFSRTTPLWGRGRKAFEGKGSRIIFVEIG